MSELVKSSSSSGAETTCCGSKGNGKMKGAELVGIKGGAAAAAPACDGTATEGETTRECVCLCVLCVGAVPVGRGGGLGLTFTSLPCHAAGGS